MPTIHLPKRERGGLLHFRALLRGTRPSSTSCNARPVESLQEALVAKMAKSERGISGNFQQKKYPVNPISYMRNHGINDIFPVRSDAPGHGPHGRHRGFLR